MLTYDQILSIGYKFDRPDPAEFARLETHLNTPLPPGYADFFTTFGVGDVAGWIRIYPPARIVAEWPEIRQSLAQDYPWDESESDVLSQAAAMNGAIIGDTITGDLFVWRAVEPSGIFVLPAEEVSIYHAGHTLPRLLDWLCRSGRLTEPIDPVWFQSWQNRGRSEFLVTGPGANFLDVRNALAEMTIHDAVLFDTLAEAAADAAIAESAPAGESAGTTPPGPPVHRPQLETDDEDAGVCLFVKKSAGTVFAAADDAGVRLHLEFDIMKENGLSAKVKGDLDKLGWQVKIRKLCEPVPYSPTAWPEA